MGKSEISKMKPLYIVHIRIIELRLYNGSKRMIIWKKIQT